MLGGQTVCSVEARQRVELRGRVATAMKLSVGGAAPRGSEDSGAAWWQVETRDHRSLTVRLMGGAGAAPARIRVPLEIRANAAFELKLTEVETSGAAPAIRLRMGERRAAGALTAEGAASQSRATSWPQSGEAGGPAILLAGPRVSMGGNFSTPSNALLVDLIIEADAQPGGRWEALLRLSLEAAQ